MTELERLLVACLEHDENKRGLRAKPEALGVVADWVEEHRSAEHSERVRRAVECGLEGIFSTTRTARVAEGYSGRDVLMLSLERKGRGRNRFVRLKLGDYDLDAGTGAVLWEGDALFVTEQSAQALVLAPSILMARWHAVAFLLGYSPLMLLACCATDAVAA